MLLAEREKDILTNILPARYGPLGKTTRNTLMRIITSLMLVFTVLQHEVSAEESGAAMHAVVPMAASASAEQNAEIEWFNTLKAAKIEFARDRSVDVSALRAQLKKCLAIVTREEGAEEMIRAYLEFIRSRYPKILGGEAANYANSPNQQIRTVAEGMLQCSEMLENPIEMAFTAIDGREVDFKKLRGKVVLIDFWATTCTPCIAEMPNVSAVYTKFRGKGFEVIGISLDREQDRPALLAFIKAHQMSWPQHFDGAGWKNSFARQYAIVAIPMTFLIDQEGHLVSTGLRGPKLAEEVKRLLKI